MVLVSQVHTRMHKQEAVESGTTTAGQEAARAAFEKKEKFEVGRARKLSMSTACVF